MRPPGNPAASRGEVASGVGGAKSGLARGEPLRGPVRRGVVRDDELETAVGLEALLREHARDAIGKPRHGVSAGHDDGDRGCCLHLDAGVSGRSDRRVRIARAALTLRLGRLGALLGGGHGP